MILETFAVFFCCHLLIKSSFFQSIQCVVHETLAKCCAVGRKWLHMIMNVQYMYISIFTSPGACRSVSTNYGKLLVNLFQVVWPLLTV